MLRKFRLTNLRHCIASTRQGHTWCNGDPFTNPADELQSLVIAPLFTANEAGFKPTRDELKQADNLFKSGVNSGSVFRSKGVIDTSNFPNTSLPEVCFIGRSNVGKSSLIKALFYNCPSTRISISKTPGHTKALKFYQLGKALLLVDMPGYGLNMPSHYVESVENYLKTRQRLARTFLLLDASVGLTDIDVLGVEMLEEFGKPYSVVLTKIDRISPARVLRTVLKLKESQAKLMHSAFPQLFLVSAQQNTGLAVLRAFIAHVTNNNTAFDCRC